MTGRRVARPSKGTASAIGTGVALSGTVLFAVLADVLGVGLTKTSWTAWAGAWTLVLAGLAVARGLAGPRAVYPRRPRWASVACSGVAAIVCGAAVALTLSSARDARDADQFVAVSAAAAGAEQVDVQITSRVGETTRYVVQIARGAALDETAAEVVVAPQTTETLRLAVPAGRGVVRLALRRDSPAGPLLRRLELPRS